MSNHLEVLISMQLCCAFTLTLPKLAWLISLTLQLDPGNKSLLLPVRPQNCFPLKLFFGWIPSSQLSPWATPYPDHVGLGVSLLFQVLRHYGMIRNFLTLLETENVSQKIVGVEFDSESNSRCSVLCLLEIA